MGNNKRAYTLFELVVVITLIIGILFMANISMSAIFWKKLDKQVLKDHIVYLINTTENLAYNSKTVGQELLNTGGSTNKEVSRFERVNPNLAYYFWLYFTRNLTDTIETWVEDTVFSNGKIFLTQFRQETFSGPWIAERFNANPAVSNQLIKLDWYKWADRYKFPVYSTYYLNKIIRPTGDCESSASVYNWTNVVFNSSSLSFDFYNDSYPESPEKGFDYTFCYSTTPNETDYNVTPVRINRESIKELYFETIRNY